MLGLIGWIGRIILIVLIMRLIFSMFSGAARRQTDAGANASRGGRGTGGGRGDRGRSEKNVAKLLRDPQCGTYVAENSAIALRHGGEVLHFCSAKCRDEYLAAPRATAV